VQAGSQSIAIFQQLGAAYQQIGLNSFAQTQFLQALKLAPLASRARAAIQARLIALAHHDIELKRYDDAIALLQQIGKSEDDRINYDRWVVLAWAELGENRLREATANLQAAIAINPDRTEAYCVLATVLTQQQDQGANAANQRCNNDSPKSKP
jgi:tetratricopeptide (TPR) repeat protein